MGVVWNQSRVVVCESEKSLDVLRGRWRAETVQRGDLLGVWRERDLLFVVDFDDVAQEGEFFPKELTFR